MSGLKYIGGGAWLPGVPARDLSAEEAKEYAEIIAAAVHVLYVTETETTVDVVAPVDDAPIVKKGR